MPYLTRDETAALLHMTPGTLANQAMRGEGPPFAVVGGRALYDEAELSAWMKRQPRRGAAIPSNEKRPPAATGGRKKT